MGFQQGLSGLNVAAKTLDVIGNNIANAAVAGFKSSTTQFGDMYADSLGGTGGVPVGIGSLIQAVSQQFTQGNITNTNNPLDVAIHGQGFFRLENNGLITYSRNGQFHLANDGTIQNASGNTLTGYVADTDGKFQVDAAPAAITLSTLPLAPRTTGKVEIDTNLNAGAKALNPSTFDATDPATYTNSISATVYDSKGDQHVVTTYFVQNGGSNEPVLATPTNGLTPTTDNIPSGALTINGVSIGAIAAQASASDQADAVKVAINLAQVPGVTASVVSGKVKLDSSINALVVTGTGSTTGGTTLAKAGLAAVPLGYTAYVVADGALTTSGMPKGVTVEGSSTGKTQLTFDSTGKLVTPITGLTVGLDFSAIGTGNSPNNLTFKLDLTSATGFANPFSVTKLSQDGYSSGRLSNFAVGDDGVVEGHYSNGQTKALAQIVLVNFPSVNGLKSDGANQWKQTVDSGEPLRGIPGTSSFGNLQSSAVEDSNVDLTTQLVNMITAQRIYQANAQSIKTHDQILQTLVNLR
jgi:flagellar hook protein FlgE